MVIVTSSPARPLPPIVMTQASGQPGDCRHRDTDTWSLSTISTIYNIYLIYQPTAYLAIVIGSLAAAAVSVVVVQLTVWRTHGDTAPTPG